MAAKSGAPMRSAAVEGSAVNERASSTNRPSTMRRAMVRRLLVFIIYSLISCVGLMPQPQQLRLGKPFARSRLGQWQIFQLRHLGRWQSHARRVREAAPGEDDDQQRADGKENIA